MMPASAAAKVRRFLLDKAIAAVGELVLFEEVVKLVPDPADQLPVWGRATILSVDSQLNSLHGGLYPEGDA